MTSRNAGETQNGISACVMVTHESLFPSHSVFLAGNVWCLWLGIEILIWQRSIEIYRFLLSLTYYLSKHVYTNTISCTFCCLFDTYFILTEIFSFFLFCSHTYFLVIKIAIKILIKTRLSMRRAYN